MMDAKTKVGIFAETDGKLRFGALLAYLLSLVAFFIPLSFEWNDYGDYVVNYFIGAINAINEPIFVMILTGIVLVLACVLLVTKQSLPASLCGILGLVLFIALLILIPDSEPRSFGGDVMQIAIRPGAFISPIAATIGAGFSFLAFLRNRKAR
ncbi:MAG: hypothetical protein LBI64_06215 [Coriobacteriales bacterium]|jgi:hypothetical protein|nr:hypothetical protein [Coriobacteriales bacterium]